MDGSEKSAMRAWANGSNLSTRLYVPSLRYSLPHFLSLITAYVNAPVDILADSLLLILPLRLIRNMPRKSISAPLRRRLYIIFSTSIVTTVVSLVHAAYIIKGGGTKEILAALVEDCMSLSVAGLPVVGLALMSKGAAGSNVTPRGGGRRAVTITTTGTQTRTGVREGVGRNVEDEAGDENYDEDAGPKFEFTRFRNRWTKPRNDEVQLTTTTARGHSRAASDGRLEVHREQGSGSASASGSGSTSRRTSKDKRSAQSGYGWGSGGGTKDMKSWVVRGGRGGRGANRTLTTTTMTMTMTMGSLSEGDFPVDGSTTDDSEDADRKDVGSLSHGMDRRGESESANEVSTRGREDVRTPPGVPASPPLPFPPPVHHRDESRHDTPPHSPRHNSSRDHTTNPSTASHTTFGIISSNARTPINQHPVEGYDLQWTPAHSLASDHHTDHDDMEEDGESGSRRQHYIWVGDAQGGDEGEEVRDEMYEELSGSGESRATSWSMGRIRDLISGSGRGT